MKQMITIPFFRHLMCLGAIILSTPIFGQSNFINIDTLSDQQKLIVKITPVTKVVDDGMFSIRIAVQDSVTGRFITGLAGKSSKKSLLTIIRPKVEELCPTFEVTEMKEEMEIVDPINIAVVLDYSGSMSHYVIDLKSMAENFIKRLSGNLFTRLNFDDNLVRKPVDAVPTKTPKSVLDDNYNDYGGGTALYAAIRDGIETLSQSKGDRALVVFTDGYENSSGIGMQTVWQKAKENNVSVYAIGFDVGGYAILDSLCRYTGGKFYPSNGIDTSIFKELGDRFSNHYILKGKCKKSFGYPVVIKSNSPKISGKLILTDPNAYKPFDAEAIQFHTFLFDSNTTTLIRPQRKSFNASIVGIAEYLIANPNSKIVIEGHSSPDGDALKNLKLASKRAELIQTEVFKYVDQKLKKRSERYQALQTRNQIKVEFYGTEKALYPATSYKNFENRRVEVKGL